MDKFIKILKQLNKYSSNIEEELKDSKKKTSGIVNTKFQEAYPNIKANSTIEFIYQIWDNILKTASKKISRTWVLLLTELDKLLKILYKNKLTLRGYLSKLRKPLKNDRFDPEIYNKSIILMGMTLDESKEIARKYKAEVDARNVNRADLPVIYVEDVFQLLDKLIKSNNVYELTLAVEIATGARSIEVFKVSKFEEVIDNPNQIRIIGLAKDKGNNNLQNVVVIRNLVYLNSKQIINAVVKIREVINTEGSNKDISKRTNKLLNKAFSKNVKPLAIMNATEEQKQSEEIKPYFKSFTSHKTRYLFGNISYLIYGKHRNIPFETYIQQQLGHLSGESTKSYLGINVVFKNKLIKNVNPEIKEYIKSVENQVQQVKTKCCPQSIENTIDLIPYKNSFSRKETEESKISKIINTIKKFKNNNMKLPRQSELQKALGYGSNIMVKAYGHARQLGLINNFNVINRS
jgi:hypothetical protein